MLSVYQFMSEYRAGQATWAPPHFFSSYLFVKVFIREGVKISKKNCA